MPILDVVDAIFAYFQKGMWQQINIDYLKSLSQFIYPFNNVLNLNNIITDYGFRWGKDFVTAFLNFIPGVQFPISYENISMFYAGEEWRAVGGVPSDLITFFYTQYGIVGLPVLFAVFGYLLRKIDNALINLSNKYAMNLIRAIICIQFFGLVASADFEAVIRGQFILIILSMLVLLSNSTILDKEKRKKKR